MHFAGVLYCSTTFLIFAVHAHPLEHAVTIGRTRRTVADGTVVDYLHGVPTVYFHGSRTGTTLHVVPALRAVGSGQHA